MKRYILWDHDGVLVDTEPLYYEATRRTIAGLGVDLPHHVYLRDMARGRTAWEHARARGVSEPEIVRHRQARDRLYQQLLLEREIGIPGVEALLGRLADDYAMAIVTTARRADFELIHREGDIVTHMDFVLANGDYARSKPAPDPYLAALERFGAAPDQALVVEDSERGLRSALAAGIDCVVVDNDFVAGQDFTGARARIESLDALPELLGTLA
ncbi:MAG: HAD family hydrolase [Pseudomonadota bacterium]